jgi:hypothetical protein
MNLGWNFDEVRRVEMLARCSFEIGLRRSTRHKDEGKGLHANCADAGSARLAAFCDAAFCVPKAFHAAVATVADELPHIHEVLS